VSSDSWARAHGRVRTFVGTRSPSQRVGVLAVVAVLLTSPFGGLKKAHTDDAAPLRLDTRYDLGPFYLTFEKVEALGDLAPAVSPEKGDRLFVVEVEVRNHSDRAESVDLVTKSIGGSRTGAVPWPFEKEPRLRVFDVADGSELVSESINPGQTYELALVVQQGPDWTPGQAVLSLDGYEFESDDPTGLDPDVWLLTRKLAEGPVDVEVKP
jgi:hypothetical protein